VRYASPAIVLARLHAHGTAKRLGVLTDQHERSDAWMRNNRVEDPRQRPVELRAALSDVSKGGTVVERPHQPEGSAFGVRTRMTERAAARLALKLISHDIAHGHHFRSDYAESLK
jgi:hypothetical protein